MGLFLSQNTKQKHRGISVDDKSWVKLYRKSLSNDIRRHDPTAWRLFETLLLLVDAQTGKWSGGIYQLADMDGYLKSSTIYKALVRLEEAGMITKMSNTRYSEIHICNFTKHHQLGNTSSKNGRKTEGKQSNTLTRIENKEIRSIYKSSSKELDRLHLTICELFSKNTNRYKLTPQRKQKLKLRLNELGEERLMQAFETIAASGFHRGDNDRGWKIDDDPYWLITSAEKAEKWANKYEEVNKYSGRLSEMEIE